MKLALLALLLLPFISAQTTNLTANDALLNCASRISIIHTGAASIHSCAAAIIRLGFPHPLQYGSFHHGAPDNAFKLPAEATVGDCHVTVDLGRQGFPQQSSWLEVWALANTLSMACSVYGTERYTAGMIRTGSPAGLVVEIRKAVARSGDGGVGEA